MCLRKSLLSISNFKCEYIFAKFINASASLLLYYIYSSQKYSFRHLFRNNKINYFLFGGEVDEEVPYYKPQA